ncbi:MAG: DUF2490 domain-containing protein [Waddliaceae bacterium]
MDHPLDTRDIMRTHFNIFYILLLIIVAHELSARDFQFWSLAIAEMPLACDWKMETHIGARFENDASRLYFYYGEILFIKELPGKWEIVPGYRLPYRKQENGDWMEDPTALFAIIKKHQVFGLNCLHRSRSEYRMHSKQWVFRQRFQCDLPFKLPHSFKPYFYEEVYFQRNAGFKQNRFFIGVKKEIFDSGQISIGYLDREVKSQRRWNGDDVLYLTARWKF